MLGENFETCLRVSYRSHKNTTIFSEGKLTCEI